MAFTSLTAVKKHISQPGEGGLVNVDPWVRFHGSTIFFCLFAVITNDHELFATARKGFAWTR